MNSLEFINKFINEFIWILQWIHQQIDSNSLTNSLKFINEFIWIHQWIHLNSSANSIEYINHLKCLQIFKKYHSFLLFGFFEKIINEFTNEFIELNLSLSFLNFSHFAKLFIKFFKSKSLPWISNRYCHSRNEFTDEFIYITS